ncbi:MAG TPA: FadD3 family acyl-CoA ligase [Microthrixaceae bacterium]|nr:FadD3 family acyl-CoA ligase [Microthrixaceae bacterium]
MPSDTTPAPWSTIPELIAEACSSHAELEALVEGDVRLTYAELEGEIHRVARGLIAAGVEHGDRVAMWAPNCWEWVVVALATHLIGGVVVPINTRFKAAEADYVLSTSRAKVLATVTDFLDTNYVSMLVDRPDADRVDLPELTTIVSLRGTPSVSEDSRARAITLGDLIGSGESIADSDVADRAHAVTGDDMCHMLFTSGTTGKPKGVMLNHGAVCRAYDSWCDVVGLRRGDRYLIVNPYFHSFGLNSGIIACLMRGVTNIPHAVFDVPAVMKRAVEENVTMLPGPPAIYQSILNHPDLDSFDMSGLRLAVTGAAAIPVEMILDMRKRLGFETIITGYGLTEATGMATMCRHDDDPETIATTSGRAIPDVEVLVVDDVGREVPRGEPGEVVVRGYNVMAGYFEAPEQTAEAIDEDGWLHTGDIGVMDERGYLRITDRLKDMFIVGGFNAYPAEIENLLLAHPEIGGVAVVGIPDDRMGEVGMAFVVPRPGAIPDPEAIIAWSREHMANYKVPRRVEIIDELPLIPAGKVDKLALRARAAG